MTLGFSRFDSLASLMAGIATVAALVITLPATPVQAKTAQEVAEIAAPLTVQVNSSLGDGSGVLIARQGNTYTVLTVNHVVSEPGVEYSIRTHLGNNYPATEVVRLQVGENDPDLAVIKFESPAEYPVATLGNSDQAVIGAQIYVFGYPATGGLFGIEREPELSPGLVTSRPSRRPEGYTLRYQAVTWSGMSGGPVFDSEARVIGLHGQGEFGFAQTSSGDVAPIKTGFNAAVPINTFVSLLNTVGITQADLKIDLTPTASTPISINNPQNAQGYYFRGLTFLDQQLALEAIADFNESINLSPTPEAFFNRGLARTLLATAETTRSNDPLTQAITDYTKAIEKNGGYADAYYNRAIAYYSRSLNYQAMNDMQKAAQDREQALADFQQAASLYKQGGRLESYQQTLQRLEELK